MTVTITVEFHQGIFTTTRGHQSWPPDPSTLLGALIATIGADPTFDEAGAAEQDLIAALASEAPSIVAAPVAAGESIRSWGPRVAFGGDLHGDIQNAPANPLQVWTARVQSPPFTTLAPLSTPALQFSFFATLTEGLENLLERVCEHVVYLGRSDNLVALTTAKPAAAPPDASTWIPDDQGPRSFRTIDPRFQRELLVPNADRDAFESSAGLWEHVHRWQAYRLMRHRDTDPIILERTDGERPTVKQCKTDGLVPVPNVWEQRGDGRIFAGLSTNGPIPAGWIPSPGTTGTTRMNRWEAPAACWATTRPVPLPAKPTVGALDACTTVDVLDLLAWSLVRPDPADDANHQDLHIPEVSPSMVLASTGSYVPGGGRAPSRYAHLKITFPEPVEGPLVIGGSLLTQIDIAAVR